MALLDHVNRLARRSVGATEPPRPASDRGREPGRRGGLGALGRAAGEHQVERHGREQDERADMGDDHHDLDPRGELGADHADAVAATM